MAAAQTYVYKVAMTCEGCTGAVDKVLAKLKGKGVQDVVIDLKGQTVKVKTTLPQNDILEVLKKTGKETQFLEAIQ